MLKPRYYYTEPLYKGKLSVITNETEESFSIVNSEKVGRCPRFTICGIWDTDTNLMSYGVSRCSENDIFVKAVGRKIAYERALHNPLKIVDLTNAQHISDEFIYDARTIEAYLKKQSYFKF